MGRIVSYGFPLAKAQTLSRMADQEATRQRKGPAVSYGQPTGEGPQIVQIWSDGATIGDLVSPNGEGYHAGRLRYYYDLSDSSIGADCWIRLGDWEDNDAGQVVGEHGRYYMGTPIGNVTSGGIEAPAYFVLVEEQSFLCQPDSDIAKGSSGTVSLYHRSSETDSTINLTAKAKGAAVTSGKWCEAIRPRGGQIYVLPWEIEQALGIHRGTCDADIDKGSSGTVSRYTDGTDSDSGTNDTVNNDFGDVTSGSVVAYVKLESNFYMIAAECEE